MHLKLYNVIFYKSINSPSSYPIDRLMLGKTEGRRRWRQRNRWLDGATDLMDMSLSKHWELVMDKKDWLLQSMGSRKVRHTWATELNWAELKSHIDKSENFLKRIFLWMAQNLRKETHICLPPGEERDKPWTYFLCLVAGGE